MTCSRVVRDLHLGDQFGSEEAGPQFKKAPTMKYESDIHIGTALGVVTSQ